MARARLASCALFVLRQLGGTALFAAKFRESAARALLLPRRRAQGRAPLWQQRKRAYDLLAVASRYASFPMLLEAYRECMRDVFDMPAFLETLRAVEKRQIRVQVADIAPQISGGVSVESFQCVVVLPEHLLEDVIAGILVDLSLDTQLALQTSQCLWILGPFLHEIFSKAVSFRRQRMGWHQAIYTTPRASYSGAIYADIPVSSISSAIISAS